MSRWNSSVEIRYDEISCHTISVGADSYLGAVVKRESRLLLRRATELMGIRTAWNDIHHGPRLIHVNKGSRHTAIWRR